MNYNKSLFQTMPKKNPNKSRFNLSHEYKAALRPGFLVPVLTLETMPGDYFSEINTEFMFRFPPLYYPVMQKYTMRCDYFYVPNRILWLPTQAHYEDGIITTGWEAWIQNQEISDSFTQVHPFTSADMSLLTLANNQVLAYMGVPLIEDGPNTTSTIDGLNAFPLNAYLKIYDEYYRNTQLEHPRWFNLNSGNPTTDGDNTLQFEEAFQDWRSGTSPSKTFMCAPSKWENDYFTSSLPTPQL